MRKSPLKKLILKTLESQKAEKRQVMGLSRPDSATPQ